MSVYLDASVLISLFVDDPHTPRAKAFLQGAIPIVVVSDFGAAEFASGLSRLVRMSRLADEHALDAFSNFDQWIARAAQRVELSPQDVKVAETFLRGLEVPLLTPDMLHVALAHRLGCELASFDAKMNAGAEMLGVHVAEI